MLFPALGTITAIWLLTAPLLSLESGFRAAFIIAVAVAVLVLAPLSIWYRRAGFAVAALGILLGFANLGLSAPIAALASVATSAFFLIVAGMAPQPINMSSIPTIGAQGQSPEAIAHFAKAA
jgi:hypothetical protein